MCYCADLRATVPIGKKSLVRRNTRVQRPRDLPGRMRKRSEGRVNLTRVRVGDAAPPGATGLVPRRELFALLDRALSGRVTVVSAPPGSGKTFLLRSWLEQAEPGLRVAWVSLERGESDAHRFWLSLVGGLRDAVSDNSFVEQLAPSPELAG